jgi:L-ascorbate metabolism protein UlaG (beta-lactamase superfamily)
MLDNITWLGHASFRIKACSKLIYIDPWQLRPNQEPADLILITHEHFDHCSPKDVQALLKKETVIITTNDSAIRLKGNLMPRRAGFPRVVKPGEVLEFEGVKIESVRAYNLDKSFHPKENDWLGFIVTASNMRIYHTGDSDFIPEMKSLNVDVILVPIGGTYTMDARDAARLVNELKPKFVIPMHYGSIVGSDRDLEEFKKLSNVNVVSKEPYK